MNPDTGLEGKLKKYFNLTLEALGNYCSENYFSQTQEYSHLVIITRHLLKKPTDEQTPSMTKSRCVVQSSYDRREMMIEVFMVRLTTIPQRLTGNR